MSEPLRLMLAIARAIDGDEVYGDGTPSVDSQLAAQRVIKGLGLYERDEDALLQELGELIFRGYRPNETDPERIARYGKIHRDVAKSVYVGGWRPGWGVSDV